MKPDIVLFLLVFTTFCFFPTSALAAEGAGGWGWWETIGRWVNLLVMFGFLYYFTREPIRNFFQGRRETISEEIERARSAQKNAEQKLAEIESKMRNLDAELEKLRSEAAQEAERERRRILEQAEIDAKKLIQVAEREISGLTREGRQRLKELAAELSVKLASESIKSKLDEQTESRILDRFLLDLTRGERSA